MKKLFLPLFLTLSLFLAQGVTTGCSTAPSERVNQVTTLKIVGASADASMKLAAQLLKDGKISREQWQKAADFFDFRFQPAYGLAVTAVQANLDSVASPDLVNLSTQLASLIASYIPPQ
jgi:hypothetical protein